MDGESTFVNSEQWNENDDDELDFFSRMDLALNNPWNKQIKKNELLNNTNFLHEVFFLAHIAQSAGAVEYTDCTSAEG